MTSSAASDGYRPRPARCDEDAVGSTLPECTNGGCSYSRFSVTVADLGPIDEDGLRRHAEVLYRNAQAELRAAGPRLERLAAFELAAGIELARKALVHLEGKGGAKRIELDIADGAPLTICMGSSKPMKLKVEPVRSRSSIPTARK